MLHRLLRWSAPSGLILVLLALPPQGRAQQADLDAIYQRSRQLRAQGNYGAAQAEAERLEQAVRARFGPSHKNYALALDNLADIYQVEGRNQDAEQLLLRAAAIQEKALGPGSAELGATLNVLGDVQRVLGKYDDAEKNYNRALDVRTRAGSADDLETAHSLIGLGNIRASQDRYPEAEKLYQRGIAIQQKRLGDNNPEVARTMNNLGWVYGAQGKYSDAEAIFARTAPMLESALGADHPEVAKALTVYASDLLALGKYREAQLNYQRALAIEEKALGPNDPTLASTLTTMANSYSSQRQYAEAEALYRRALPIQEKAYGPDHPTVANTLERLADAVGAQQKYAEAETLLKRAAAIEQSASGANSPRYAAAVRGLADASAAQGRYAEAEYLYRRALAIQQDALGSDSPAVALTLQHFAMLYTRQRNFDAAKELGQRALGIQDKALGPNSPAVALTLAHLAMACSLSGDKEKALDYSRRASQIILSHARDDAADSSAQDFANDFVQREGRFFRLQLDLAARADIDADSHHKLGPESFAAAQWALQSSAALAIEQASVRAAAGDGPLAALVRQYQDLSAAWRENNKRLTAALSNPDPKTAAATTAALLRQIADSDARRAAIGRQLEQQFPQFAALTNPQPLAIDDVKSLLGDDEALVFFLVDKRKSYVFAATRGRFDWATIAAGADDLTAKIAALRNGLDVSKAGAGDTAGHSGLFDLELAHELYRLLLGGVEGMTKDKKQLIVVPSGVLTALPFHALVTEKPPAPIPDRFEGYRDAAWLIKRQAVDVLPSVTSLKLLRTSAPAGPADKPMVGFGDPLFAPKRDASPESRNAKSSRAVAGASYSEFWQGASIDRSKLAQALPQIPDTAVELSAVARSLDAAPGDIHLGADASETMVKRVPLDRYRIVYFATHGLVAGDVKGLAEPSLALSIPGRPTDLDDGLLTASEIAQLKLNADWVVLSACNTIAGDKPGAEALSGLARAFFYAGARALLVSHWAIDSDAAVRLTTTTFDILRSNGRTGRAEALRQAMIGYLNDPSAAENAYPAMWAPFALIGEGSKR